MQYEGVWSLRISRIRHETSQWGRDRSTFQREAQLGIPPQQTPGPPAAGLEGLNFTRCQPGTVSQGLGQAAQRRQLSGLFKTEEDGLTSFRGLRKSPTPSPLLSLWDPVCASGDP